MPGSFWMSRWGTLMESLRLTLKLDLLEIDSGDCASLSPESTPAYSIVLGCAACPSAGSVPSRSPRSAGIRFLSMVFRR